VLSTRHAGAKRQQVFGKHSGEWGEMTFNATTTVQLPESSYRRHQDSRATRSSSHPANSSLLNPIYVPEQLRIFESLMDFKYAPILRLNFASSDMRTLYCCCIPGCIKFSFKLKQTDTAGDRSSPFPNDGYEMYIPVNRITVHYPMAYDGAPSL
jgi:hypothetical protein